MPDTTAELPSAALIAAGKCPGWRRGGYGTHGHYAADSPSRYVVRDCSLKITRGDLCGLHDNMRRRDIARVRAQAAERQQARDLEQRVTYANNVAMMLHDTLARKGAPSVHFDVDARDGNLTLDVDRAKALLDWLGRLS